MKPGLILRAAKRSTAVGCFRTSYASIKGQSFRTAPADKKSMPADELSAAEIERVAAKRNFVLQHMPEFVDFIKELHAAGLIAGWRSVQSCRLLSRKGST